MKKQIRLIPPPPRLPGTITLFFWGCECVCVYVVRACLKVVKQQRAHKYGLNDGLHPQLER